MAPDKQRRGERESKPVRVPSSSALGFPAKPERQALLRWGKPRVLTRRVALITCCCSVTQSCPTLFDSMVCRVPGFPVLHCLPEFVQTHVHQVGDAVQPSCPLLPTFSCPQAFPASGSFPGSQFSSSGGQCVGALASASVLPVKLQGGFPLGLTGLITS